ncbi:DUF1348 family protein [Blastococcus mobilis]|uniref:DUF1348 family protein n=1 Tax=Blastococcus mobilis TaxID=1938746 RepID=UPI0020CD523B|nr:DUF1348 family protein [Blastococcus mobilis]
MTLETAEAEVQAAEDAWKTRDPERVGEAYTSRTRWRNGRPVLRRRRRSRRGRRTADLLTIRDKRVPRSTPAARA